MYFVPPRMILTKFIVPILCAFFAFKNLLTLSMEHPYRDRSVQQQNSNLGELFPRFGNLYSSNSMYSMYYELKIFLDKYVVKEEKPFTVYPDDPAIHFLTNSQSLIIKDWFWKYDYLSFIPEILESFNKSQPIIFFRRRVRHPCNAFYVDDMGLDQLGIKLWQGWKSVEEGDWFCVLQKLYPGEKLQFPICENCTRFEEPMFKGKRLDLCRTKPSKCGEGVAKTYCDLKGFSNVFRW